MYKYSMRADLTEESGLFLLDSERRIYGQQRFLF